MSAIIEEALREKLRAFQTGEKRTPYTAVTFKGRGLQPGVDLEDSADLLERMEATTEDPRAPL